MPMKPFLDVIYSQYRTRMQTKEQLDAANTNDYWNARTMANTKDYIPLEELPPQIFITGIPGSLPTKTYFKKMPSKEQEQKTHPYNLRTRKTLHLEHKKQFHKSKNWRNKLKTCKPLYHLQNSNNFLTTQSTQLQNTKIKLIPY